MLVINIKIKNFICLPESLDGCAQILVPGIKIKITKNAFIFKLLKLSLCGT